jgi:hypothetical protein
MGVHRTDNARHAPTDKPARFERPSGTERTDDSGLTANGVGQRLTVVRGTSGEYSQPVVRNREPLRVTNEGCDLVTLLQRPRDDVLPGAPRGTEDKNSSR